jgi:hypothetical protein
MLLFLVVSLLVLVSLLVSLSFLQLCLWLCVIGHLSPGVVRGSGPPRSEVNIGSPLAKALPPLPSLEAPVDVDLPALPLPFANNRQMQRQLRELVLQDLKRALVPYLPMVKVSAKLPCCLRAGVSEYCFPCVARHVARTPYCAGCCCLRPAPPPIVFCAVLALLMSFRVTPPHALSSGKAGVCSIIGNTY